MRRVRLSRFFICCSYIFLSIRAMSDGDHGINRLSTWENRRTRVEWNGDDHDCYTNKCCPSKKSIQGDEGQRNLGNSGIRNIKHKFILTDLPELGRKSP